MRVLIIVLIFLLLIGGAAGAYFALGINPFGGEEDEVAEVVEVIDDPHYLSMRPFIVPITEGQRISFHADVRLALEPQGEENLRYLQAHANILRDVYMRELAAYLNLQWVESGDVQIDTVKQRLRRVADQVVGRGYVNEVQIMELNIRQPGQR